MRVAFILRRIWNGVAARVHETRLAAVIAVTGAIVAARRLSLSAVGRAINSHVKQKHSIKRVDRLLENPNLFFERHYFYSAIASYLARESKLIVLVDWSKMTEGFYALTAAVPIGGRALIIYGEVHPEKELGDPRIQAKFLSALREILPPAIKVVVVTDAGFHGPFFRAVQAMGWDFVGRIRGRATMTVKGRLTNVPQLYDAATTTPRDLGRSSLYGKSRALEARLVLMKAPRRSQPHPWQWLWTNQGGASRTAITGNKDPWLLATSLEGPTSKQVVQIYATRMQIEETFRDMKNHRFGWNLRHVRSQSHVRLNNLLLLTALAMFAVVLVGMAAEDTGLHRGYQANTVRRRVLSFFVLGVEVSRREPLPIVRSLVQRGLALVGKAANAYCDLLAA